MSFVEDNFNMLCEIGLCIARQFGEDCEVVLHDLTRPYDNTIVAIWNGHVTGRKIGGGGTNTGLKLLRGKKEPCDEYCYINETADGRLLKSSSKYFVENGKIVGSLCINQDISEMMAIQKTMEKITMQQRTSQNQKEVFTQNVEELLNVMMQEELRILGKSAEELSKEEKIVIVHNLDEKGAFLIKKAAEQVAEFLGTSRFTIYNYLNASGEGDHEQNTD